MSRITSHLRWAVAVPTLGYGVSYAGGNVLLALWGTVIVALL